MFVSLTVLAPFLTDHVTVVSAATGHCHKQQHMAANSAHRTAVPLMLSLLPLLVTCNTYEHVYTSIWLGSHGTDVHRVPGAGRRCQTRILFTVFFYLIFLKIFNYKNVANKYNKNK